RRRRSLCHAVNSSPPLKRRRSATQPTRRSHASRNCSAPTANSARRHDLTPHHQESQRMATPTKRPELKDEEHALVKQHLGVEVRSADWTQKEPALRDKIKEAGENLIAQTERESR